MGACSSSISKEEQVVINAESSRNRTYSFHENLVLQRYGRDRFEKIYEVVEEIGHGGLCTIYKIEKRQVEILGPARKFLKKRSSRTNRRGGRGEGDDDASDSTDRDQASDNDNKHENKNIFFALKVINLAMVQEDKIDSLKNEVEILKTLDHKNIIKGKTFLNSIHWYIFCGKL